MKVFGPYTRKDGRQHVVLQDGPAGKLKTVSYPKYLVEQRLGRELDPDEETIDHIDGNWMNNAPDNIRIISRSQHIKEDAIRVKRLSLPCVECGVVVERHPSDLRARAKIGAAGPFCSRICSGKYGARRQQGGRKLPAQPNVKSVYYKVKKNPSAGMVEWQTRTP
jgi:hypothetical protein